MDSLMISETEIDDSFADSQFFLDGYWSRIGLININMDGV